MRRRTFLSLIVSLLVTACSSAANTPAGVVEQYFKTLIAKDEAKLASLSCAAWESDARRDSRTFSQFPASAENVQCREAGADGGSTIVACTGKLVLDYNGDKQQVDLADRQYRTIQEDGTWKMCGYK
jgi:hypothetical protein